MYSEITKEADDVLLTPHQAARITGCSLRVFLEYHELGDYPAASESPLLFSRKVILEKIAEEGGTPRETPMLRYQPPKDGRIFAIPDITGWEPERIGRFAAGFVNHHRNRYKYGSIYIVETIGADFVKIGWAASDVARRVESLAVGCPYELRLVLEMPGSVQIEKALHKILCASHFRGEWFSLDEQIKCFIKCAAVYFPQSEQDYLRYLTWKRGRKTGFRFIHPLPQRMKGGVKTA